MNPDFDITEDEAKEIAIRVYDALNKKEIIFMPLDLKHVLEPERIKKLRIKKRFITSIIANSIVTEMKSN